MCNKNIPTISDEKIDLILNDDSFWGNVNNYIEITKIASKKNVTDDEKQNFEKLFCDLYKLSMHSLHMDKNKYEAFKEKFFELFWNSKNTNDITFNKLFEAIKSNSGRCEMSFTSKMLHTLNNNYPIWDEILRNTNNFDISRPNKDHSEIYENYCKSFEKFKTSDLGTKILNKYKNKAKERKIGDISDCKIIDFVLWQNRAITKKTIESFIKFIERKKIEIYNEDSLKFEFGVFLRDNIKDYKIQFERNVSFFGISNNLTKSEIDVCVFNNDKTEKYAIELKYHKKEDKKVPERMFDSIEDIAFMEELKEKGFTNTYCLVVTDSNDYYDCKRKNTGIYEYFRKNKAINSTVQYPTKNSKNSNKKVTISGTYSIKWQSININQSAECKYYILEINI